MQESTIKPLALPGFGTAHLMGRIGARESTRLIHAALDCGVGHFDTARVYGLGDTEEVLGHALRRRPDVSIFTKVGQGHPHHSFLRAQAHAVARPLARTRARFAHSRPEFLRPSLPFVRRTDFSLSYVRESVETSLRMLRRDTLDGLLLHEITAADVCPELVALLEALTDEGKIRRFGVASEPRALSGLSKVGLPGDVLQQSGGPFVEPIEVVPLKQVILHSLFGQKGADLRMFQVWLAENPHHLGALLAAAAAEDLNGVPALLVSYTSTQQDCARILIASTSERHIQDNAIAIQHRMSVGSLSTVSAVLDSYKNRDKERSSC